VRVRSIITLNDLGKDKIYVDIKKEAKEILKQKIRDNFKTYKNFSKYLNLKLDRLSRNNDLLHFFGGHKVRLNFVKKIVSPFSELGGDFIKKNLYKIGSRRGNSDIYNPKFPFEFDNKSGIRFISAILHDGGISKDLETSYRNNNKALRRKVVQSAKDIFGELKYYENRSLIKFPKFIGVVLKRLGLKEGKKVFTNPKIPKFIFKSNLENKALFLRQAFDDESCVPKPNRKYITLGLHIDVTKQKRIPNLINGLKKLLEEFGIVVTGPYLEREYKIKNNLRQRWNINIYGRKYLEIFYNKIGFTIKKKRDRLKKILEAYKTGTYSLLKNQRYKESLDILFKNYKNKHFTIKQATEILNLDYHYTKQLIWKMERENFVIRDYIKDRNVNFYFK